MSGGRIFRPNAELLWDCRCSERPGLARRRPGPIAVPWWRRSSTCAGLASCPGQCRTGARHHRLSLCVLDSYGGANGASVITFAAIVLALLSPRADEAYIAAIGLTLGCAVSAVVAAAIEFALLPALSTESFAALAAVRFETRRSDQCILSSDRGASSGARGVLDEKESGSSGPNRRNRTDGGRDMKSLNQMRPDRTKHAAKRGRRDQPSGSRDGAIKARSRSGVPRIDRSQNRGR